MSDGAAKTLDLGPVSVPDAHLLLDLVQQEIKAAVDGGTFTEDPQRFEQLAALQATLHEAIA